MQPKTLFFDIETAPIEGYTWEMREADVVSVRRPTFMLAWAAKWQGSKSIIARTLHDYRGYSKNKSDDLALCTELHKLLDEADIVVAHNADFDIKKACARFLANGLPPPSPFKTFCTLKLARKAFRFDSNKLDVLGGYLGIGRKVKHTGINLWLQCMEGDPKAWRVMKRYNRRDVELLEGVFDKMKGYATNFPDKNMWSGANGCPVCQSSHITKQGAKVSKAGWRQQFKCQDCGNWFSLGRAVRVAA